MDYVKKGSLLLLCSLFFFLGFCGCSRFRYLIEQGVGQMSLQQRAKSNSIVLKDPAVDPLNKRRIRMIESGKSFFYSYFGLKPKSIYSRTTFLRQEAVSYLVVASPFNAIEPKEFSFPFVGRFPYLGFFQEESANQFIKELQAEGYVTWKRPVYAYSTLGYFEDTILSSFFVYPENVMMETVFHELFHTIFFAESEVELNENLANYFGRELFFLYAKIPQKDQAKFKSQLQRQNEIDLLVVKLIMELKKSWEQNPPSSPQLAKSEIEEFLQNRFYPSIKKKCFQYQLKDENCPYINEQWNQASFSAFMTYEAQGEEIEHLHHYLGTDLKGFYSYIKQRYEEYQKQNVVFEFTPFLLAPIIVSREQCGEKNYASSLSDRSTRKTQY